MTLRSYGNTSPVRCGVNPWTIPNLASTRSWAAKHFGGVLDTWDHHKARASPWQPTPYQWAPLTERAQELPSEALERKDFGKFVQFFRQASPYIEGHRGRNFVVVIPGEVQLCSDKPGERYSICMPYTFESTVIAVSQGLCDFLQVILHRHLLQTLLEDIQLLHGKVLLSVCSETTVTLCGLKSLSRDIRHICVNHLTTIWHAVAQNWDVDLLLCLAPRPK